MKLFAIYALALPVLLLPCRVTSLRAQPLSSKQAVAKVPARYKRALEFLYLLKKAQGNADPKKVVIFDEAKRPFRDISKLLGYVSARGVALVDVNVQDGKPLLVPRARLRRDLGRMESRAFSSFAYLGFISAMPYAQYSGLDFLPTSTGVIIRVASGHVLVFGREGGVLKLSRLEYRRVEGH